MQIKMNEMQALIDRRDAVIARFAAIENEKPRKLHKKEITDKLSSKLVSTAALGTRIKR